MNDKASDAHRRRLKKRQWIPIVVSVLLFALFVFLYFRGTLADGVAINPQSAQDDAVAQLYREADGRIQVRGAIVVAAPASRVWSVVCDYDRQPDFMPYVVAMQATPQEGGRVLVKGVAGSRLWGDWPFEAHVDHKVISQREYVAAWDEPGTTLSVNRGSWTLTETQPNQTLIVYALEVETPKVPAFLVRNVILDRVPGVLRSVRAEVNRRETGR